MAKSSGGTRNYTNNAKVLSTRKSEYHTLMETGNYNKNLSYFDKSGGFVVVHNGHNKPTDTNLDKSETAVRLLAEKGYKIYLDDERATVKFEQHKDGYVYKCPMEIKTINNAGKNTIKSTLENASKQGATVAILYQNTPKMNRTYVENQIDKFKNESPKRAVEKIDWVIVVGANGNVHRHKMK